MMATRLKETDAVLIGVGLVGTMLGRELTKAGLKVVGLERGNSQFTVPDFQGPHMHDELRYSVRKAFMQDNTKEAMTFRNNVNQVALPIRRWESFLPGTGLGGAAVHWNGQTYRFQDDEFKLRSHTIERYGKDFIDSDLTIQDWGFSAAEIEPYYDRFEYLLGTSGQAGNVKGQKIAGGNPFEDPRSRPYPTPPMKEPYGSAIFRKAAAGLGYHPFPQPSSNLSQPYTNPEGMTLQTCMFCGYCERFACEHYAKSSPQTILLPVLLKDKNFTLRTQSHVTRINLSKDKKSATGVTYVDATGKEFEQPAKMVILCSFALNNVRMMLLSGIGQPYDPKTGQGTVGRNYAYQTMSAVQVFFDESVNINPFMRSGANGTLIADFVGDNFDHGPHKFIGGAYFGDVMTNGRPIGFHPTPPGTPQWARPGSRRWCATTTIRSRSTCTAARWPAATTTWTSTPPTRTPGACHCCASPTTSLPTTCACRPTSPPGRSRSGARWAGASSVARGARDRTASPSTRPPTTPAAPSWGWTGAPVS
jgi:gluconate 2-dehydrogenase alpha chain